MTRALFARQTIHETHRAKGGERRSDWSRGRKRDKLKDSMRPHLGYLHYVNTRVLHYVSAPRTRRWITLMSRERLGRSGHKSDLYTNMSALVAAKSPGFKSEIRLASITSRWSGRHDPICGRAHRRGEFYCFAAARARRCSAPWNIQRDSLQIPALCSIRLQFLWMTIPSIG